MSRDPEGYDPAQVAEEAEARRIEHENRADLLDLGGCILESIATKLAREIQGAEQSGAKAHQITIGAAELVLLAGEELELEDVAEQIRASSAAVLKARDHEAGVANAAQRTAEFAQGKLDQDAAADDLRTGIENS
ncbi:hypothetical protein A2708_01450 [Candidatus Saccharibacteria bacterium RIFCSPHIGHO2_01_FULL_49_21]|nr:MAG: hypothetical protein A2708_01450 [Candidatus Saccharibacteria bacterium RIFCSPHIGHO2_01_FULL_49_21]